MNIIKRLESYMQAAVELEHFSGVVMVAHHGKVILHQGYGVATEQIKNRIFLLPVA
jgi:hypothetical protein